MFFDETPKEFFESEPQKVLFFSSEDSLEYTLKARLRKAGANFNNIFSVDLKNERFSEIKFNSKLLKELIEQVKPALIVFDPLQAFIPVDMQMGQRNAMRACLSPLIGIGEQYGVTSLIVVHTNKKQGVFGRNIDRQLIYRTVEGSYAYRFAPTKSSSGKRDIPLTENVKKALIKQKEIDLVLGRRAKEQKVDGEKGLIFITRNGTPINSRNFGKALDGLVKAYNRKEVINAESEHRDPVLLPHINPHGRVIIRTS